MIVSESIDADTESKVMDCWKSFKGAVDDLTPQMVNTCWKDLWSEVQKGSESPPLVEDQVEKIMPCKTGWW